jgi:hypothetical protein
MNLQVDPARFDRHGQTGIFVRATLNGKWGSYDIAELYKPSLLEWLRSGEGMAERVLVLLLDHEAEKE